MSEGETHLDYHDRHRLIEEMRYENWMHPWPKDRLGVDGDAEDEA